MRPARLNPRALAYYLGSLRTLLGQVRNWPVLAWDLAGLPMTRPYLMRLVDGTAFWIRSPMDAWIVKEVYLDRDYLRPKPGLGAGWTVVDIGAHIGAFSVLAAGQAPELLVHAFEPTLDSYALLCQNVRLNQKANVITHPLAVGAVSGVLTLYTFAGHPERNVTLPRAPLAKHSAFTVPALSLSDIFEWLAIERCDFLKLDCEGAEFAILLGAPRALLRRIRYICLEYHDEPGPFSHGHLLKLFADLRFRIRCFPSPVEPGQGFMHAAGPDAR